MRRRRTKAEVAALTEALCALAEANRPCSVRQCFYLAVSEHLVAKDEAAYRRVSGLLADARERGDLAWSVIVDHTRAMYRPYTFSGLRDALDDTRRVYRRALWRTQPWRVEVWTEARTLMGALQPVANEWDVPLFPCGGQPSRTFLHDAGEDLLAAGRPTAVLYLGDHDGAGHEIENAVVRGLRRYAPGADIHCERLAITEEQIETLNLPTRPPKGKDRSSNRFARGCVEVEALSPGHIRRIVDAAIRRYVDVDALARVQVAEESERRILDLFAEGDWRTGADEARGYEYSVAVGHLDAG